MASDRQGSSDGDGYDDDGWQLSDVNGDFIEMESLFELISIASIDEFLNHCKNIDSIFQSRLRLILYVPHYGFRAALLSRTYRYKSTYT